MSRVGLVTALAADSHASYDNLTYWRKVSDFQRPIFLMSYVGANAAASVEAPPHPLGLRGKVYRVHTIEDSTLLDKLIHIRDINNRFSIDEEERYTSDGMCEH